MLKNLGDQNSDRPIESASFRESLPSIVPLAVLFFFSITSRFVWGPLLVEIEKDFGISHVAAGSLFLYITFGYFVGMFSAGYVSSRLNHRLTIVLSCLVGGISLILANFAPGILFLRGAFILLGAAGGLYLPSGVASLTANLAPKDFGKAFSIHEAGSALGFVVGPLVAEFVLSWGSWRHVTWPLAAGLLLMGLYHKSQRRCRDHRGEPITLSNVGLVISKPIFWVTLFLFVLGIGANPGLYAVIPLYLQIERGMDQTFSNLILSGSRIVAMAAPFVAGLLSSRYGIRPILAGILLLTGIMTIMLGVSPNNVLWLPVLLQSVLSCAFFTPGYAMMAAMVPSNFRNLVVALIMPAAMLLGAGGIPTLMGAFGDAQRFYLGFILIGVVVALSTALLYLIRIQDERGS